MRILRLEEAAEWRRVLERCCQHDVYHLPEYHALAERCGEGSAHLFLYEEGEHMVALPLLLRSIQGVAGLEQFVGESWKDATSVYGYAGPLSSHAKLPPEVVRNFAGALRDALHKSRIIAAFSRLHPLIPQTALLGGLGECPQIGTTVSVDLTLAREAQRSLYRANHRREIAKLQRLGVLCVQDTELSWLDHFIAIYTETMRRVSAHESYFFDRDYFVELAGAFRSEHHLFVALKDDEPIAGGIFMVCDGIVQYHLGGTRGDALKLAPMKLIFDTVREWACAKGLKTLHLGGGVGSQEDSLYRFKAGFSDRRHPFHCWRWIVQPDVYARMCASVARFRERHRLCAGSPMYFPEYRARSVRAEQM